MNNIDPCALPETGKMLPHVVLLWGLLFAFSASTPLDDYVNAPDPYYEYRDLGKPFRGADYTTHFLNMTSQKWLNGKCLACASGVSPALSIRLTRVRVLLQSPSHLVPFGGTTWR